MKLAIGYIVFDGLETLEGSIRSIRDSVDLVLVSYQLISWGNTKADPELLPKLQKLKGQGLIDHIIEFKNFIPMSLVTPGEVLQAKAYECEKRQSLLNLARSLGATHYTSMDADEFYIKSEFDRAKQIIIDEELDATAVKYINYLTPTLHQGYSKFQVPFIYKIGKLSCHHSQQTSFSGIDPTRGILDESHTRIKVFDHETITMHHMEMVRKDLLAKYLASSRFFRDRGPLPLLVEDIEKAKVSEILTYTKIHFGDTPTGMNTPKELFESPDLFGLNGQL